METKFKIFLPFIQSPTPETIADRDAVLIDISSWQTNIRWSSVFFIGFDGVIIKTTEGTGFACGTIESQWNGAGSIGLLRSAYHFYKARIDGAKQAQWFLQKSPKGEMPPVLDLEDTVLVPGQFNIRAEVLNIMRFIDTVETAWNQPVGMYSGAWYMDPRFGDVPEFRRLWKWTAHYKPLDKRGPQNPIGWVDPVIWQYSSTKTHRGMFGNVDTNICMKKAKWLYEWAGLKLPAPKIIEVPPMKMVCVTGGRYIFSEMNFNSKIVRTARQGEEMETLNVTLPWVQVKEGFVYFENLYNMFV